MQRSRWCSRPGPRLSIVPPEPGASGAVSAVRTSAAATTQDASRTQRRRRHDVVEGKVAAAPPTVWAPQIAASDLRERPDAALSGPTVDPGIACHRQRLARRKRQARRFRCTWSAPRRGSRAAMAWASPAAGPCAACAQRPPGGASQSSAGPVGHALRACSRRRRVVVAVAGRRPLAPSTARQPRPASSVQRPASSVQPSQRREPLVPMTSFKGLVYDQLYPTHAAIRFIWSFGVRAREHATMY